MVWGSRQERNVGEGTAPHVWDWRGGNRLIHTWEETRKKREKRDKGRKWGTPSAVKDRWKRGFEKQRQKQGGHEVCPGFKINSGKR